MHHKGLCGGSWAVILLVWSICDWQGLCGLTNPVLGSFPRLSRHGVLPSISLMESRLLRPIGGQKAIGCCLGTNTYAWFVGMFIPAWFCTLESPKLGSEGSQKGEGRSLWLLDGGNTKLIWQKISSEGEWVWKILLKTLVKQAMANKSRFSH